MSAPRESQLNAWPPLPLDVHLRRPVERLPFPLETASCRLFSLGRHALWHGFRAIGLRPGDEILVPAYHHGSEVEALQRRGLEHAFYDVGADLQPEEGELDRLRGERTRALYLIHYLGFPQDAARWRRWCDERGLLLIEDAAQAWLAQADGRPVGSVGDLTVFCLYKTFGLPDGAASLSRHAPPDLPTGAAGVDALLRRHARWLLQRSQTLGELSSQARTPAPYVPETDFELGDPSRGPARSTAWLLPRVTDPRAAEGRRARYRILLEAVGDQVPAPFRELPEGASPFAFPVATDDKAELLHRLRARGIRALDLWSTPHSSLPVGRFPRAGARRAGTVGLPVHQELSPEDIDRIAAVAGTRKARHSTESLEPLAGLEAAREVWSELAERSGNIFATWEWASIWWRHLREEGTLTLSVFKRGGRPVAILPLYLSSRGPVRLLRFVGHGPADELGPICAARDRIAAGRALARALRKTSDRWDLFLGEHLPGEEDWGASVGGTVLNREASPVLRIEGTWDEFMASRSSNFRQQLRRRERRLVSDHGVRYRLAADPGRLPEDLDALFRLHEARWQDFGITSLTAARQQFHRDFAARALERGWLRLWFAEVEGQPIAGWYGFRYGDTELYYQSGRDPAWDRNSVGFVLLGHSMREAFKDGMREYRLLRGGEQYKARFATGDRGLQTLVRSSGALGGACLIGATAARGSRFGRSLLGRAVR